METVKKGNKQLYCIIILIIIVLGLSGYIVYDKVILKNNSVDVKEEFVNTNKDNDTKKDVVGVKSYFKKSITEDFKNECSENLNRTVSIDIPYIISDKENAVKLNNQILDYMNTNYESLLNDFENASKKVYQLNVSYEYIIKNNIIYIYVVDSHNFNGCSAGGDIYKNYFYDINNDKILSLKEGFDSLGYNLDSLKEYGIISYEECENSKCGCGIKITDKGEVKPFFFGNQCA